MKARLTIRLEEPTDWGDVEATEGDREAYEQAVTDAILEAFPGADVTVEFRSIARPRAAIVIRDLDGYIMTDEHTQHREEQIEEDVIRIAQDVWDAAEFWPYIEAQS